MKRKSINKIKKIKAFLKKKSKELVLSGIVMCFQLSQLGIVSGATDKAPSADSVLAPLKLLIAIFLGAIQLAGVVVIAKNVTEAVHAYQQQDSSGMYSGIKGAVGGVVMFGIGTVLQVMGIKY